MKCENPDVGKEQQYSLFFCFSTCIPNIHTCVVGTPLPPHSQITVPAPSSCSAPQTLLVTATLRAKSTPYQVLQCPNEGSAQTALIQLLSIPQVNDLVY